MPSHPPRLVRFHRGPARGVSRACALLIAAALGSGAVGQEAAPPQTPPTTPATPGATPPPSNTPSNTPSTPAPARKDEPRSLDDLLGVPKSGAGAQGEGDAAAGAATESAEDAARREQQKRLERSLNEASMQDLVQRMVEGMKSASDRLTDAKDPGLGTQRIQEEVVKTLDRLLEEAQKQQGKKSSSSKKKQQQKQGGKDQKQDPSEQNGQQQKPRPSRQSGETSKPSGDPQESSSDAQRDDSVAEGQELSETRIEWGQLPERVRELVLQGRRDRVSTIYERLTREYYRRLAEEASR